MNPDDVRSAERINGGNPITTTENFEIKRKNIIE
jgi:hypothetical protein